MPLLLTSEGLTVPTKETLRGEIQAEMDSSFGGLDFEADGPARWLVEFMVNREHKLNQAIESVYMSYDASSAQGRSLDNMLSFLGSERLGETLSVVTVTLTGDAGARIPAGWLFEASDSGEQWKLSSDVTIGVSGTVDGVLWAVTPGPVAASADTITIIVSPVDGLSSVTNALQATLGSYVESDFDARIRRDAIAFEGGDQNDEAIRQKLVKFLGSAYSVSLVSNHTAVTDSFGLAPTEMLVSVYPDGGSDWQKRFADELRKRTPPGVRSRGALNYVVTDERGYPQQVEFSIATVEDVFVYWRISKGPAFPADGAAIVNNALIELGNSHDIGEEVYYERLRNAVYDSLPAGSVVILTFGIGLDAPSASAPGMANINVSPVKIANFTTGNIDGATL